MSARTLLLIDGPGMMYRSLFSPGPRLSARDGTPTHGIYYFLRGMLALLRRTTPTHVAVAMDPKRETLFRRKLYPGYKVTASREKPMADEDILQLKTMATIVEKLGLVSIRIDGYEADDVIATLARGTVLPKIATVIASSDKDLHQLISKRVTGLDPRTMGRIDVEHVTGRWGLPPNKVAFIQALCGDSMDGVPGVRGIGPGKALALIRKYGTLNGVIEAAEEGHEIKGAMRDAILNTDVRLMFKLVRLTKRAPVKTSLLDLTFDGIDKDSVNPLLRRLGIRPIGSRLEA